MRSATAPRSPKHPHCAMSAHASLCHLISKAIRLEDHHVQSGECRKCPAGPSCAAGDHTDSADTPCGQQGRATRRQARSHRRKAGGAGGAGGTGGRGEGAGSMIPLCYYKGMPPFPSNMTREHPHSLLMLQRETDWPRMPR